MQYSTKGLDSAIQAEPAMLWGHQVPLYLKDPEIQNQHLFANKVQTNKASLIP